MKMFFPCWIKDRKGEKRCYILGSIAFVRIAFVWLKAGGVFDILKLEIVICTGE